MERVRMLVGFFYGLALAAVDAMRVRLGMRQAKEETCSVCGDALDADGDCLRAPGFVGRDGGAT